MKRLHKFVASLAAGSLILACAGSDGIIGNPPTPTSIAAEASTPPTIYTEAFTGTAGALTGTWTQQRTSGTISRNGSGLGVGSVNAKDLFAFWSANTFSNDQYSQARIASGLSSGSQFIQIIVRANGAGDGTYSNYLFYTDGVAGANHTEVAKNINGTQITIRSFPVSFAAGDIIKISAVGTTITCYKNGVAIGSITDASLPGGSPGIGVYGSTIKVDDWEGGSIAPAGPPVASVSVTPATASIVAGDTQQFTATMMDANGDTLGGRTAGWTSDAPGVASVNATTGLVTAVAQGSATITATSEGQSGSASITVTPASVATVNVSPASATVMVSNTQQLTATTLDSRGVVITGRQVQWASDNAAATVDQNGLVTGISAGSATITATSEGKTGTSAITVIPMATTSVGPLRVSSRNRRYFETPSGQIVYLTGSHTWSNLQDNGTSDPPPAFNYAGYLDFLTARGHNFMRLWAWEQTKWTAEIASDYWFSPGAFQRTGPGTALDGKPKFDLTQFNQSYFDRLRERVQQAGARGIYVSIMLFDGWSVTTKPGSADNNPWKGHPFNSANNINGINGDANRDGLGAEVQTLRNSSVTALQDAYVRKVIDAVNDLDNVLFEIDNEGDASSKAWQYHMIQLIRDYEATKPKKHPVGITAMWPSGVDSDLYNSSADWVSPTGSLDNPAVATGSKVIISDTDHLCGICGTVAWVWKSFTRGQNPILMDGYDGAAIGVGASDYSAGNPVWEAIRKNLGYARSFATRMNLAAAVPRGDLASSGYCLAAVGSEYLVFLPSGGSVSVNLAGVSGQRTVEWLNPANGQTVIGSSVRGGSTVIIRAPFSGPAVAYIRP